MRSNRSRRALLAALLAALAAPVVLALSAVDRQIALPLVIGALSAVLAASARLPPAAPIPSTTAGPPAPSVGPARGDPGLDPLTGLPCRQAGLDLLDATLTRSGPTTPTSVLYLDIDRFHLVNDTFGLRAGDQVLRAVARRVAEVATPTRPDPDPGIDRATTVTPAPTVIRWGGDAFLVVAADTDTDTAVELAAALRSSLAAPVGVDDHDHDLTLTVSIGHLTVDGPDTADRVVRRAEHRMAERRMAGAGRRAAAAAAGNEPLGVSPRSVPLSRLIDEDDRANHQLVRDALARNRIEVWFQPIFSVTASEQVVPSGAEALVRLRMATGELLAPARFLPGVDRSDLGRKLDERVTSIAFDDFSQWRQAGLVDDGFRLSVNLCEISASDVNVTTFLADQMRRFRIPPDRVVVELAETIARLDGAVVERIRQLGVVLAIDDFGLASSNLDRARDVGVEIVKLDRRWMGPPERPIDARELDILRALVNLCATLDVHVVAEGIETVDQLTMLLDLGVSQIQGYFLSKPLHPDDFASLLARYRRRVTTAAGDGGTPW